MKDKKENHIDLQFITDLCDIVDSWPKNKNNAEFIDFLKDKKESILADLDRDITKDMNDHDQDDN